MTNENTQAAPKPAIEAKPKRTIEEAQKELEEVRVAHMQLLREIRELMDDAEKGEAKMKTSTIAAAILSAPASKQ